MRQSKRNWNWARSFARLWKRDAIPDPSAEEWSLSFVRWWYRSPERVKVENADPSVYSDTKRLASRMIAS